MRHPHVRRAEKWKPLFYGSLPVAAGMTINHIAGNGSRVYSRGMAPPTYYDFEVRIAYADTDRMGVVYYANYLVLFERGRTEFLRNLGVRYRDMEEKLKIFLPATESHIAYLAPAHYDDLIKVRTYI